MTMTRFQVSLVACWMAIPVQIDAWILFNHNTAESLRHHPSLLRATQDESSSDDPFRGISRLIDDGNGNIRSDLATSIWNWDNEHRNMNHLPKFEYSTRAGLRLVDEIAQELLQTTRGVNRGVDEDTTVTTYSDLIQDGVVTLMQCMAKYNEDDQEGESFEHYARRSIISSLTKALAQDVRPIRLPGHVMELLKQAHSTKEQLSLKLGGRQPTLAQVAAELDVEPKKLELYQLVSGVNALSVERTMEIFDPLLETTFEDYEQYKLEHFFDQDDESFSEEGEEGEDEMWVHQEQIAAPLRDMIPDNEEPTPAELLAASMIHDDVEKFLKHTLNDKELTIIQMRYGLEGDKPRSLQEVGQVLGVTASRVQQMEQTAMKKLQTSYTNREVETYLEEEHEETEE